MQHEATRNGREAWMQLVNKYEHLGSIGKAAIQSELIQTRMDEREDPDVYFQKIERMQSRLVELGETAIPDSLMLGIALRNLPSSHKALIDILDTDDDLTYQTFKARISTYYRRNVLHLNGNMKDDETTTKALFTNANKKKSKCFGCGELGHYRRDCPKNRGANLNTKDEGSTYKKSNPRKTQFLQLQEKSKC
jgi:hypothetical protein